MTTAILMAASLLLPSNAKAQEGDKEPAREGHERLGLEPQNRLGLESPQRLGFGPQNRLGLPFHEREGWGARYRDVYPGLDDGSGRYWHHRFRGGERDYDRDFGWYFNWSPDEHEWERDYGYPYTGEDHYTYPQPPYSSEAEEHAENDKGLEVPPVDELYLHGFDPNREPDLDPSADPPPAPRSENKVTAGKEMEHAPQSRGELPEVRLNGEIIGFSDVGFHGEPNRNCLVRVALSGGRAVVVDLGPARALTDLFLESGDRIDVRGHPGSIDGRNVLFADDLTVDGSSVVIQRKPSVASHVLRGTIAGVRVVQLNDDRGAHVFVKLLLPAGHETIVDLGLQAPLERFRLRPGDRVLVGGRKGSIDHESVLMVSALRIEARAHEPTGVPKERSTSDLRTSSSGVRH